jgi:hypothetical protein
VSQPSPYTPGQVAREVPGRHQQLAEIDERLAFMIDLRRLVGRIRVDIGPRGLGKTSLLREVQRRADAKGALTVWVTAGESVGLISAITAEIERRTAAWSKDARSALRNLVDATTITATAGLSGVAQLQATWSGTDNNQLIVAGTREFEELIGHTALAASEKQPGGLVLLIDEIQSADPDGLRVLAFAWQHLQVEAPDVPAAVFSAGLPTSPEIIGAVVTFSERFAYRPIGALSDEAARIALTRPANRLQVRWQSEALDAIVHTAQGFPYTLQLFGDATWAAAGYPKPATELTAAHVEQARLFVSNDLAALFRARWEKATPAEQVFMAAMASLGDGPVARGELAAALAVASSELSVPRARLIDKGLIDTAGRGNLVFTIPGFADYVRAHHG